MKCDGNKQFEWCKCVASSMWTTNNPILTCNTMEILIIVEHWDILYYAIIQGGVYGVKFVIWVRRLHLLTINNINYFRCDSRMCYFEYVEGIFFDVDDQIDPSLVVILRDL